MLMLAQVWCILLQTFSEPTHLDSLVQAVKQAVKTAVGEGKLAELVLT